MARYFMRVAASGGDASKWIEKRDQSYFELIDGCSTGELIAYASQAHVDDGRRVAEPDPSAILSPITVPTQLICQFTNYGSHLREAGRDPEKATRNIMFAKAASSIAGPNAVVTKPEEVGLLDYEIEIGLVVGRAITGPASISDRNLADYAAGLVLANDLSARDVQIPEQQAFKGKSFRGFTPCGPVLALFDQDDWLRFDDLRLRTEVNGSIRQDEQASDMVFKPAATLSELSRVMDLAPGDVILTGTPGGTALKAPGKLIMTLGKLLPERAAMQAFLKKQKTKPGYLSVGDRVRCALRTDDGAIDLGEQNFIIGAPR